MTLRRILVGNLVTNCYLLFFSDRVAVIDPGDMPEKIVKACGDLPVSDLLLTHGHLDHTGAMGVLCDRYDPKVWMHEADIRSLNDDGFRAPASQPETWWRHDFYATNPVKNGEAICLGPQNEPLSLKVIHTPGHTPGSICFHSEERGILFSGDTLFKGAEGRTDFPGGNSKDILASLRTLSLLPADTAVYPGHGFATTVGKESWIREGAF